MNMKIEKPPFLDIDYPRVYAMNNLTAQQTMNASIYALLLKLVQSLQSFQTTTYVSTAYEIKNNQKNVLSLTLSLIHI